jgi:hypothetical protein
VETRCKEVTRKIALGLNPSQRAGFYAQLDERTEWFYEAYSTSAGMVPTTPGLGSVDLYYGPKARKRELYISDAPSEFYTNRRNLKWQTYSQIPTAV